MKNIKEKLIKNEVYYVMAKRYDDKNAPIDDNYGIFKEIKEGNAYFITSAEKIFGKYKTWAPELKNIIELKRMFNTKITTLLNDYLDINRNTSDKLKEVIDDLKDFKRYYKIK